MDGVVWPKDEAGMTEETIGAGVDIGVPGPWIGAGDPSDRLDGG